MQIIFFESLVEAGERVWYMPNLRVVLKFGPDKIFENVLAEESGGILRVYAIDSHGRPRKQLAGFRLNCIESWHYEDEQEL